jgi:ATP-independent RNA helicase DbpA
MTAIQKEALPLILENNDVIAQAKTGSGKTAAFGIGILDNLDVKKFRIQSLILCPTRELADQVTKELRRLARMTHNIKILTLCGGAAFGPQLGSLRHGAHIVVGTPGRIMKHLDKESLNLDDISTFVLDEADRMLDMGFIEDIEKILSFMPKERQTLLFSATYPDEIESLSKKIQKDAITIKTAMIEETNLIEEFFYEIETNDKVSVLVDVFAHFKKDRAIVFCNTKIEAQEVAKALYYKNIDALAIHGDLEQYERSDVLVQFDNYSCSVLVATDVAARGLDIKELDMVINYDMPHDEAIYTHRIGRTGRAGEKGLSVSLFTSDQARDTQNYENGTRLFESSKILKSDKNFKMMPKNSTLVIEGGKKDKVRAGDLLGALTGDAGIDGNSVGKINIFDKQAYVAIDKKESNKALARLKDGKIKGRKFSVWMLN